MGSALSCSRNWWNGRKAAQKRSGNLEDRNGEELSTHPEEGGGESSGRPTKKGGGEDVALYSVNKRTGDCNVERGGGGVRGNESGAALSPWERNGEGGNLTRGRERRFQPFSERNP